MRKISILIVILLLSVSSALAQQVLKAGESAPAFSGQGLDGAMYDLGQLQGKVVVLTFWSTRCEICHSEIPKLNGVADRYRG
ncbi:MAG: TlpA family protein disulfide reductase, partial [Blastocatellia bacterium]|nr:TlpA family protein disulfide reductase [Blastocatellia bacterium]